MMKNLGIAGQWIFAIFMAAVSFCISFFCIVYFGVKLMQFLDGLGLKTGWAFATSIILIPTIVAAYVGAITVPNSQLKNASIVFPTSIFLIVNFVLHLGKGSESLHTQYYLETGTGCVIAAICLYIRWKRQLIRRERQQSA